MSEICSAELSGKPDSSGWSQAQELRPDDPSWQKNKGRLFIILSIESSQSDERKAQLGKQILTSITKRYFGELFELHLSNLKSLVEEVVKQSGYAGINIELGIMVVKDNFLYAVAANGARLGLLRGDNFVEILKTYTGGVISASGRVQPSDTYILASKRTFSNLPRETIKISLSLETAEKSIEDMAPSIHSLEETGLISVMVVSVGGIPGSSEKNYSISLKSPNLRHNIAGKIDKILAKLPERRIIVNEDSRDLSVKKNKKPALIGAMLLMLLAISIFFGIRQRAGKLEKEKYLPRLEEAKHQYEEAKSIASLNTPRARELILSARDKLDSVKSEGVDDPDVVSLSQEIVDSLGEIAGIYEYDPDLFLDLSLIRAEFKIDDMSYSSGSMRVLDINAKKVVNIDTATKKTNLVDGVDLLDNLIAVSAYSDRTFVLSPKGIHEVGDEVFLEIKPEWDTNSVLIDAFAGNIYVLVKAEGKILRYPGTLSGFADSQEWFGAGVEPNLNNVVDWAIDGSIWTLTREGEIDKYSLGVPERFNVVGLDLDFNDPKSIFTDEDYEYLYVLDKGNNRIVVIDKNGNYKAEYISDKIGNASGLVVSEIDKKIIFAEGSKLYYFEAKHLK